MPTPPLRLAPLTPTGTYHQQQPQHRAGAGSPSSVLRSPRSPRHVPLLSLTPCALGPIYDDENGEEGLTIKEIWNVISRTADVVKDGDRLENLAWRHWGQPKHARRSSLSSNGTGSSISLQTPTHEQPPPFARSRSFEKRSFGGMLKLLVEENEFKDWVEDAKLQRRRSINSNPTRSPSPSQPAPVSSSSPIILVPSATIVTDHTTTPASPSASSPTSPAIVFASELNTPVAQVEFRVVEPTPVPSRVGSLGGSVGASSLLARATVQQPSVNEEEEEEGLGGSGISGQIDPEVQAAESSAAGAAGVEAVTSTFGASRPKRSPRKKVNRFFIQSSPSKMSGSGSESSQPSPIATFAPAMEQIPPIAGMSNDAAHSPLTKEGPDRRKSSETKAEAVPTDSTNAANTQLTTMLSPDPDVDRSPPHRRSSEESSSVIVMRKRGSNGGATTGGAAVGEKRHVSIATMRGRFAGEKARAAEVIDARNRKGKGKERDLEAERSSDWEDDDDDEWEDEEAKKTTTTATTTSTTAIVKQQHAQRQPPLSHRRTSSRSASGAGSGLDLTKQISRPTMYRKSSSGNTKASVTGNFGATGGGGGGQAPSTAGPTTGPSNKPGLNHTLAGLISASAANAVATTTTGNTTTKPMSKKEKRAELARIEAEKEAQRKREMFAKQQIFGPKPPGEGLLTGIFRSGKSMVDLTRAGQERDHDDPPIRRAPTHVNLGLARSPIHAAPLLLRSKSAVAMPVQSGVSVTASIHHHDDEDKVHEKKKRTTGIVMESSDDSEDEDDRYLASSQVRRKIDELAARRDKRTTTAHPPSNNSKNSATTTMTTTGGVGHTSTRSTSSKATTSDAINSIQTQAVPVQLGNGGQVNLDLDENGVVRPISPTARRRIIIMREMSESLRRNIILEREKSAGGVVLGAGTGSGAGGVSGGGVGASAGGVSGVGGGIGNFGHTRPPPSLHTSRLPTSSSAINLTQLGQAVHGSNTSASGVGYGGYGATISRQRSNPDLTTRSHSPQFHQSSELQPHQLQPHQSQPHQSQHQQQAQQHHSQSPGNINHPTNYPDPARRRTNPSILGGGYLRPLTRVGDRPATAAAVVTTTSTSGNGGGNHNFSMAQDSTVAGSGGDGGLVNQTRSASKLSMSPIGQRGQGVTSQRHSPLLGINLHHPYPQHFPPQTTQDHSHVHGDQNNHRNNQHNHHHSPGSGHAHHTRSLVDPQAQPMMRRLTDGDHKDLERARLKRELAKRSETMDTSYRIHGW